MPTTAPSPTPKATALSAIEHLKDTASYEEMMYELYVLQKIERGREDLRTGRSLAHEAAKDRLVKKLG